MRSARNYQNSHAWYDAVDLGLVLLFVLLIILWSRLA